jgi:hypothetical protein
MEELLAGGIDESAKAMSSFSCIAIRDGSSDNDDPSSLGAVAACNFDDIFAGQNLSQFS